MGKGSPRVTIRLSPLFLAAVETAVRERNALRRQKTFTVSQFIQQAIAEKLNHRMRSRRKRDEFHKRMEKQSEQERADADKKVSDADEILRDIGLIE